MRRFDGWHEGKTASKTGGCRWRRAEADGSSLLQWYFFLWGRVGGLWKGGRRMKHAVLLGEREQAKMDYY